MIYRGYGEGAVPVGGGGTLCPAPKFPWWMIAVAAAVGIAGGYVVKDQMDKKKDPKPE